MLLPRAGQLLCKEWKDRSSGFRSGPFSQGSSTRLQADPGPVTGTRGISPVQRPQLVVTVSTSENTSTVLGARWLRELKASVHADGVAQLLPQDALLAVVGQLQEVETGGGGGQAPTRLLFADREEAPQDAAQGVPRVLEGRPRWYSTKMCLLSQACWDLMTH